MIKGIIKKACFATCIRFRFFSSSDRGELYSKRIVDDLIEILSIPSNASVKQIREAYYKLAKRYHPDINPEMKDRGKLDEIKMF